MKLNTVQFEAKFELPSNLKTKRFKFEVEGSDLKSKPSQKPQVKPQVCSANPTQTWGLGW